LLLGKSGHCGREVGRRQGPELLEQRPRRRQQVNFAHSMLDAWLGVIASWALIAELAVPKRS
jgi:hypothetical protein